MMINYFSSDAACKYISSFTGEELIEKIVSEVIEEKNDKKDITQ